MQTGLSTAEQHNPYSVYRSNVALNCLPRSLELKVKSTDDNTKSVVRPYP